MKKKRRNPIHAYKHLLAKDYDWDYGYLIALEKKKLQRMHDYFKISDIAEDNKYTTRDLGNVAIISLLLLFSPAKISNFY
jgi:hypothetical protein